MSNYDRSTKIPRDEWQRGTLAWVMTEWSAGVTPIDCESEDLLSKIEAEEKLITTHHAWRQKTKRRHSHAEDFVWIRAFATSHVVADLLPEVVAVPSKVSNDLRSGSYYTYHNSIEGVMGESTKTLGHLPMVLLYSCYCASLKSDHPFNSPESLSDIADIMDSKSFRMIIEHAMYTANGLWAELSSSDYTLDDSEIDSMSSFRFNSDGTYEFSKSFRNNLRNYFQRANSSMYSNESSAGCPARFKTALFKDTPEGIVQEALLRNFYGHAAPRSEKSAAQSGLDYIANSLRALSTTVTPSK